MIGLLRPYRGRMALMFVALLIETGAGLAPPFLAGRAIDAGITAGRPERSWTGSSPPSSSPRSSTRSAPMPRPTWSAGSARGRCRTCASGSSPTSSAMSIGFFTRNSPGVLISRMTNDVEALQQLVTDGVVTIFSSTLTLVGVVVILLLLDVKLALITFLTFPLLAIASLIFRIVSAGAYRATRERIAAVTAYLQESLSGVRVVRSFGQEPRHVDEMTELNEANRADQHEDGLPQRRPTSRRSKCWPRSGPR